MELIYIWIKNNKSIKDQEFNFSTRHNLKLLRDDNGEIVKNKKDFYELFNTFPKKQQPNNFFGESISNVTGIIGKNGSGKSTLLQHIISPQTSGIFLFLEKGKFIVLSDINVSIKDLSYNITYHKINFENNQMNFNIEKKADILYSEKKIKGKKILKKMMKQPFEDKLNLIYFDNVFDTEFKIKNEFIYKNNLKDLSLNSLYFLEAKGNKNIFFNKQIMKSLNILTYLKKLKEDEKIKIEIPKKLYISNINLDVEYFNDLLKVNKKYTENVIDYIEDNLNNHSETFEEIRNKDTIFEIKKVLELKKKNIEDEIEEVQNEIEDIESIIFSEDEDEDEDEISKYKNKTLECQEMERLMEEELDVIETIYSYLDYKPMQAFMINLKENSKNNSENIINVFYLKILEILLRNGIPKYDNIYYFFKKFDKNKNNFLDFDFDFINITSQVLKKSILLFINPILSVSEYSNSLINPMIDIEKFIIKNEKEIVNNTIKLDLNKFNIQEIKHLLKNIENLQNIIKTEELIFNFNWNGLSSGELNFFNIFGRFYDLKDFFSQNPKIENTLIILDEPEFYFHPEWQRRFLDIFLSYINELVRDSNKKIQIITASHSPFIASDLPRENIIMLDSKTINEYDKYGNISKINCCKVVTENKKETFGANIFDLYKEAFFVESTFGEFSKNKIKEIIELLTKQKIKAEDNTEEDNTEEDNTEEDNTEEYNTEEYNIENDVFLKEKYNLTRIDEEFRKDKIKEIKYIINSIGEKIIRDRLEKAWKEYSISKKEDNYKKIERLMGEYNLKTEDLKKYIENNGDAL